MPGSIPMANGRYDLTIALLVILIMTMVRDKRILPNSSNYWQRYIHTYYHTAIAFHTFM